MIDAKQAQAVFSYKPILIGMNYDACPKLRMHDVIEKNRTLAVFCMILVAVAFVGVSSVVVVNTSCLGTLAFSLRLMPYQPAADVSLTHTGSSATLPLVFLPSPYVCDFV